MTRRRGLTLGVGVWLAALVAQAWPAGGQGRAVSPGEALPDLTPIEFSQFRLGLDDFTEVESAEEGLGPAFNGTSCAVCHNVPAIGGSSVVLETRVGYRNADGSFRGLNAEGESLMHLFSTPTHGCQPMIPDDVTVVSRRAPIPLFGAGLVEAIADETLLARDDPFDRDGDGVSGRAAIVVDVATRERRVGRFGWKAQHATLLAFGADAYRNEMGITNDLFQSELAVGITDEQFRRCDPLPEPEDVREIATGRRGIDNFESFMRFLAPVARGAAGQAVTDGERVFAAIGCAACHVPTLSTGPSTNPLFDRKPVALFSDLLLHDIGTGDGIAQGAAQPDEMRTPALWGLRVRRPLLHDGSAATIEDAIARHRHEAELARRGFDALPPEDRARLVAFLRSL